MNRARPWIATLIALTGNSPFWLGLDTGYASYRTELFRRFPMAGTPNVFASRAEYDELVSVLVATGSISDASKIYWDIRPSSHAETIEFRMADVCMTIDEAVMVAGLTRALAQTCLAEHRHGVPIEHARPELLRAAKWRAARYGLDGELIDVDAQRGVPAPLMVRKLLRFLQPALEETDDWAKVTALVEATLERGNGASRQRAAFKARRSCENVVDLIVAETARGTGC